MFSKKDSYKAFKIEKSFPIDELSCHFIEMIHTPTGAKVIHIANEDPENLFCIGFQTIPASSNGVAHILEHTVLCGSKKFPIKDPFFSMTRRSLNTFMNALTGSDFTCYLASSQVKKDFYNLLEVYLDAVFHPELKYLSFLQEGHRLEFQNSEDPKTPLAFKGVVFNEMKGAMGSIDERLWHTLLSHLTPDLTYAFNSGGDPLEIPSLTYEGLIEFHQTYYHPSRSIFFFYGNFDLKEHLDFIDKQILSQAEKKPPLPPLPKQKRFDKPKNFTSRFPVSDPSQSECQIAWSWLTCEAKDQDEVLALTLLDVILMDHDASPLKKALIDSKLCKQAESMIDSEMSEVPWVLTLKGCKKEDAEKIETFLFETLKKIAENKILSPMIDSALHQLEFERTEISAGRYPFGLLLFFRSALAKAHGANAEYGLMIHSLFDRLGKKLKNPNYLSDLIHKYLLKNTHRVRLTHIPDINVASEENEKEKQILEEQQAKLTAVEVQKIIQDTKDLKEYQSKTESQDIDCLPKVTLEDVPEKPQTLSLISESFDSLQIFHHSCFTNQILYTDIVFDLPELEDQEIQLLPLFSSILTELGTKEKSYERLLQDMQLYTGGIDISLPLFQKISNPDLCQPAILFRGKSLYKNSKKLLQLMCEYITSIDFDNPDRIHHLILEEYLELEHSLQRNAMRYAIQRSLKTFSLASYLTDIWYGLSYFQMLKKIKENLYQEIPKLIQIFKNLQTKVLGLNNAQVIFGCDEKFYHELKDHQFYSLSKLPFKSYAPWKKEFLKNPYVFEAHTLASPVSFNSLGFHTIGYLDTYAPTLLIATELMENIYLHTHIREKGGAYGSGANYSPHSGTFYFYSYRDPHIVRTKGAFLEAIQKICRGEFNDRELEEAKLGILQNIDAPISPGSRAFTAFSWKKCGKNEMVRTQFRKQLIHVTKQQVIQAAKTHLLTIEKRSNFVSFASKDLVEKENLRLQNSNKSPLKIHTI